MKLDDVKTIGIIGGGVMGGGIAQTAILSGYSVIVRDLSDEILSKTRNTIIEGRFGLNAAIERGKQTKGDVEKALARLQLTTELQNLKNVDLIIEAIGGNNPQQIENKDMKLSLFADLDAIVRNEAVFVSNTSRITIADLASVTKRKDRFLGMHWFSPANIMKVVEVIWTKEVTEENISLIEGLCDKLGKTHVRVKDVPGDTGFVGNRIWGAARREANKIVEEGLCTKEGVNQIMMGGFNWPVGPLPIGLSGARTGWQNK